LRHKTQAKHIHKINSPKRSTYTTSDQIAATFSNYFTTLYDHNPDASQHQRHQQNQEDTQTYLNDILLPALSDTARAQIAAPIETEEIAHTLKAIKPHKFTRLTRIFHFFQSNQLL
ncbi:Hypothetical predicted protein, partial [Pelobates cultripes]